MNGRCIQCLCSLLPNHVSGLISLCSLKYLLFSISSSSSPLFFYILSTLTTPLEYTRLSVLLKSYPSLVNCIYFFLLLTLLNSLFTSFPHEYLEWQRLCGSFHNYIVTLLKWRPCLKHFYIEHRGL